MPSLTPRSICGRKWRPEALSRTWPATGITYFTIVIAGLSTLILIPLALLFLGMVRAMALFEGKLVEGLLGTRMPRRERAAPPNMSLLQRMVFWVKDGRTWASMVYMIVMLPAGVCVKRTGAPYQV